MEKEKIRKAEEGDLEQLCNLLHQLSPQKGDERKDAIEEEFRKIRADSNYRLVVYEDERIIGTAMLFVQRNLSHNGRAVGHIENVVTDKTARGKGIGKKLIDYLTEVAKKNNCYKIRLDCTKNNSGFYEKCGFRKTDEIEMRYDC